MKNTMSKLSRVAVVAILCAATAASAFAESGRITTSGGDRLGTYAVYDCENNRFGFWIEIRMDRGSVWQVFPEEITEEEVRFSYIEYEIAGGYREDYTMGSQWIEVATGQIVAARSQIGQPNAEAWAARTSEGSQNTWRRPIANPTWFVLRFVREQ